MFPRHSSTPFQPLQPPLVPCAKNILYILLLWSNLLFYIRMLWSNLLFFLFSKPIWIDQLKKRIKDNGSCRSGLNLVYSQGWPLNSCLPLPIARVTGMFYYSQLETILQCSAWFLVFPVQYWLSVEPWSVFCSLRVFASPVLCLISGSSDLLLLYPPAISELSFPSHMAPRLFPDASASLFYVNWCLSGYFFLPGILPQFCG